MKEDDGRDDWIQVLFDSMQYSSTYVLLTVFQNMAEFINIFFPNLEKHQSSEGVHTILPLRRTQTAINEYYFKSTLSFKCILLTYLKRIRTPWRP